MKIKQFFITVLIGIILVSGVPIHANESNDPLIINELKGEDLTQFANTENSMDNMKSFCYGWMIHSKDKKERPMFTQIAEGCIVFQAERNEFLPGGYLFSTNGQPGLSYQMSGLKPNEQVKLAYVINIDPISYGFTNRLLNFEIDGVGRETIAIEPPQGISTNLEGKVPDAWGDSNDTIIPKDYLGKDLKIVFSVPLTADENGNIDMKLVNYSAAHYPLFMEEKININLEGNNAPFKFTIKAIQFLKNDAISGIEIIEENPEIKIPEVPKQEFSDNLELADNANIYFDGNVIAQKMEANSVIYVAGAVTIIVLLGGVIYLASLNFKRKDLRK